MGVELDRLERGSSVLYAGCGGIWVMILHASPAKADMLLARPALAAMKRKHPTGFPTLTWVLPEAGFRMEHDARQAAAEVTQQYDAVIRAQATLIEGSGFQAAAVRAIVSGLDVMSRSASSKRVFSELAPAVAWCLERSAQPAPASDVAGAIAAARDAVRPRRA